MGKSKSTLIVLLLFSLVNASLLFGQQKAGGSAGPAAAASKAPRHAVVSLHESMINSFFASIGSVSGKGEKNRVKYVWTVEDPKVDIEPGVAHFQARVRLVAAPFKTVQDAKGQVKIEYVRETNRLRIRVEEAIVKLSVPVLGKHIPVGSIDIAKYYRPTFEFAGPQPIQKEVEVELPDGGRKKIRITPKNETLALEKDQVSVYSDLVFAPGK